MSSPGGEEVGRVSVRVVPDSSGFRRQLQSELAAVERGLSVDVPVEFDVDTAGLRAQLESIRGQVNIPVNLDPDIARLRAQLASLDRSRVTIPVDLEANVAELQARLAALSSREIRISVDVTGVASAVAQLQELDAIVRRLDGRNVRINIDIDGLVGALAQLAALQAALGLLGGSGGAGSVRRLTSRFAALGSMVASVAATLFQASAIAAALAVAGAAITAAWGAVATAIAAVPAALYLAAAPIGAILLGMEGIKRAAATLTPEFNALRSAVEATFERGMLPVFERLRGVFPTLTAGLQGTASAVSGVAQRLADMVASAQGLQRLRDIFHNVNRAITDMGPGIAAAVDGLLILGSQTRAFDALTTAVNTFGQEFRASVIDLISGGQLQAALRGLEGTLRELARAFVQLVDNGIRVFAAAAPGVNAFLASLTGFFERFNWTSLGRSVGGVFQGLASAIDAVPQGVIDDIAAAFAELADTFRSPEIQANLTNMLAGIPAAIRIIAQLTRGFTRIGSAISTFIQWLARSDEQMRGFNEGVRSVVTGIFSFLGAIGSAFANLPSTLQNVWNTILAAVTSAWTSITGAVQGGVGNMQGVLAGAWSGVQTGVATAWNAVVTAVQTAWTMVTAAVQTGLATVQAVMAGAWSFIQTSVTTAWNAVVLAVQNAWVLITTAIQTGITMAQTVMATAWAGIQAAMQAAWNAIVLVVQTAWTAITTAIQTGITLAQTVMASAWTVIQTAVATAWNAIVTTIQTAWTTVQTVLQTGIALVQSLMTNAWSTIQSAVTFAWSAITSTIQSAIATIQSAVQAGVAAVQSVMAAAWSAVRSATAAAWSAITSAISSAWSAIRSAVASGASTVQSVATAAWSAIQSAAASAWAAVVSTVSSAMSSLISAVSSGISTVVGFMSSLGSRIAGAVGNLGSILVSAGRSLMDGLLAGIRAGLNAVLNFARSVAGRIAAVKGPRRVDLRTLRPAGEYLMRGLRDGLSAGMDRVRALVARLTREFAQVRFAMPQVTGTREFADLGVAMGDRLVTGLQAQRQQLIAEARSLADDINTEMRRVEPVHMGFDAAATQLHTRVRAEVADTNVTPAAAASGAVEIVQNFNVPSAERASDKAAHSLRRLSRLGMWG